jgi:hypothetical protein
MTTTISNQHITEHDGGSDLFIREINHPEIGQIFQVLFSSDGSYAGSVSDGSDCTFSTLGEAEAYMAQQAAG